MAVGQKAYFLALNARLTAFVEETVPLLPELVGDDAEHVAVNLRRWSGERGQHSQLGAAYLIDNYIAPWPAVRRRWEAFRPGEASYTYRMTRDGGILYAARLALESLDQLLGADAAAFEPDLRSAMSLVHVNDNAAEHVRETMRGHPKARSFLEKVYPPAHEPRRFGGQQQQQQQQQP